MATNDSNDPPKNAKRLPPGVGAATFHADGTVEYMYDPCTLDCRWEGVCVESTEFKKLDPAEKLFQQAMAFLRSAIILCEACGEEGSELTWPRASVCRYCEHHATELFLKGCLLRKGVSMLNSHDVGALIGRFYEKFPDVQDHFDTPWWISAREINQILGVEVISGIDATPDQLYRYGIDKQGNSSSGVQIFSPGYTFNRYRLLESHWLAIWNRIP